jgi:hypothetical protein
MAIASLILRLVVTQVSHSFVGDSFDFHGGDKIHACYPGASRTPHALRALKLKLSRINQFSRAGQKLPESSLQVSFLVRFLNTLLRRERRRKRLTQRLVLGVRQRKTAHWVRFIL